MNIVSTNRFLISLTVFSVIIFSLTSSIEKTNYQVDDCIVVLGGGITYEGKLGDNPSKERINAAVKFYKNLAGDTIFITSGRHSFYEHFLDFEKTEAQAMKEYAISLGIPQEIIITEERSMATVTNEVNLRKLIRKRGLNCERIDIFVSSSNRDSFEYAFKDFFEEFPQTVVHQVEDASIDYYFFNYNDGLKTKFKIFIYEKFEWVLLLLEPFSPVIRPAFSEFIEKID
jgi:hypothetical protein